MKVIEKDYRMVTKSSEITETMKIAVIGVVKAYVPCFTL